MTNRERMHLYFPVPVKAAEEDVQQDVVDAMMNGMPDQFNRIHELPEVDSEDVSLIERVVGSRF